MIEKEIEIINEIPNINKCTFIYKVKGELINHLIEIQKEDLEIALSDIFYY